MKRKLFKLVKSGYSYIYQIILQKDEKVIQEYSEPDLPILKIRYMIDEYNQEVENHTVKLVSSK